MSPVIIRGKTETIGLVNTSESKGVVGIVQALIKVVRPQINPMNAPVFWA